MSLLVPARRPTREILDDARLSSDEMARSLADLDLVNRLWGSSRSLAAQIAAGARENGDRAVSILDVGAGAGDLGPRLDRRLRRRGITARVVPLDLQWRHLVCGRRRARGGWLPAIAGDALRLPFGDRTFDWAVSTLVFHHFTPEENVAFLRELERVSRRGFAVRDVRRHVFPMLLIALMGRLVFRSRVSVLDGVASVRQAYTPEEAREIAKRAVPAARLERVFPFALVVSILRP